MIFAAALPVLIGTAGLAFDFGTLSMKRSALQAASDQAATAGAKQLGLASATDASVKGVVSNFLKGELTGDDATATNTVLIDRAKNAVTVELTESWTPFFAHFLNANVTPIVVHSTAALSGESRLCILSLNPSEQQSFRMMNSAKVQAPTCGVYSNSTDPKGMDLQNFSTITAAVICTSGGISAAKSQTSVTPQVDCPPVADPLAGLPAPTFSGCDFNNYKVSSGVATLNPGVYCGGLTVASAAVVTLNSGTYVVKDGPLALSGGSFVSGMNVGFYLTGAGATLQFSGTSTINLSGAETGPLAGLLFYADRAQADGTSHSISSINVLSLTGTIYLPTGDLTVDPSATVGANSAYTAIIVNRMRVQRGPTLTMNTNYGATKVPVPDGVRSAATVVLTN